MKKRLMMALAAAALVATMLPGLAAATSVPFASCDPSAAAQVTSIDISPYPVSKGAVTTISMTGTVESKIKNQKADVDYVLSYSGIQLLTGSVGTVHFQEGPFTVSETVQVPTESPSGSYNLVVSAASKDSEPVLCIQLTFNIN